LRESIGLGVSNKANLWTGGVVPYVVTVDRTRVVIWRPPSCPACSVKTNVCIAGTPNHCGPVPCKAGELFIDGKTCMTQVAAAQQAAAIWPQRTGGRVQFNYLTASPPQGAYADLDFTQKRCSTGQMISPIDNSTTHSIGMPLPGDPGYPAMKAFIDGCNEPLGASHELGHVLGFAHHQQRSDRNLFFGNARLADGAFEIIHKWALASDL
jgi:hypothetical protein